MVVLSCRNAKHLSRVAGVREGLVCWITVLMCTLLVHSIGLAGEQVPVFPQPMNMIFHEGALSLDNKLAVIIPQGNNKLQWVAEYITGELGGPLGAPDGNLTIHYESSWNQTGAPAVFLGTADGESLAKSRVGNLASKLSEKQGAYVLTIDKDGATVLGRDAQGVYYGSLSLLQLFSNDGNGKGNFTRTTIIDTPYHFYRGMRASLPRGKPRMGEVTHDYFRNFLRLLSYFKINHVWVQGTSWGMPLRRHPELAWNDVLTFEQAQTFDNFSRRYFMSMDGSLDWNWLYHDYKHLTELYPDETWHQMRREVRKRSRLNPCPSNPETWRLLFETMEDTMEVLSGDHFAIPLDEMYQEYHGSRWAVCPLCRDKHPVKLWADFANRLMMHVIKHGRTPIMSAGMLLREHQGWYKNIYQAIDMIENRNKIVIYNWSEGHIRRGAMKVKGRRLRNPDLKTTPFFRQHGYKDVMHMLSSRWKSRPELREVNGKLDCYGGFVTYYHKMNYETMKQRGTLAGLVFSAQHLWSPDSPTMDSNEDRQMCRYGEALADAVLHNKSFIEAIALARKVYRTPGGVLVAGASLGRSFESRDPAVNLIGKWYGGPTNGEMRIELPIEESNPQQAQLILTIRGWSREGEGEIYLNGHKVDLKASKLSKNRDYRFPPIRIPPEWLKFDPEPNVLLFVRRSKAGFRVKKATIVISEK